MALFSQCAFALFHSVTYLNSSNSCPWISKDENRSPLWVLARSSLIKFLLLSSPSRQLSQLASQQRYKDQASTKNLLPYQGEYIIYITPSNTVRERRSFCVCKFTRRAAFVIAHDKLYHPVLPEVSPSFCHDGLVHSQFYDDGLALNMVYHDVIAFDGLALSPAISPQFLRHVLLHTAAN